VPLSLRSTMWYRQRAVMPLAGKVTVCLASHRLQWFIHLRALGVRKGDEHPPALIMGYSTLYTQLHAID